MIKMTFKKRKKNSRLRGTHTHGWGSKKKHRGAGNRGGRGKAGSGKRADAKKPGFQKNPKYFGKYGFTPIRKERANAINLKTLFSSLGGWLREGKVRESKGVPEVNLETLGYGKLIGAGPALKAIAVVVSEATAKAVEKIEKAGGSVKLLSKREESKKPAEEEKGEAKKKGREDGPEKEAEG